MSAVVVAMFAMLAAGAYLALSRDLLRCVVGLSLLGMGVNLLLLASGRLGATAPPLVEAGALQLPAQAANPLPQALVLTAIVIGFALTCFALVLVLAVRLRVGLRDSDALRLSEPGEGPDGKPLPLDAPP